MNIKKCATCKQKKPISEFNKRKGTKDGHQHSCRYCTQQQYREHYSRNKTKIIQRNMERKRSIAEQLIEHKKQLVCVVCGEDDYVCLDFHHLDQDNKDFNIAETFRRGVSWSSIEKEMEKCICLCSNCHRKVHANRIKL